MDGVVYDKCHTLHSKEFFNIIFTISKFAVNKRHFNWKLIYVIILYLYSHDGISFFLLVKGSLYVFIEFCGKIKNKKL